MKVTDIRPIPKYILAKIRKTDNKNYPEPDGHVRCYAYLTTWKNELVKVTVAVKHRYKKWYCKQVAVHGLNSGKCLVKDMEYCYCASMGFRFGWHEEGLQKYEHWYERGWCWAYDKYYDPYAEVVNLDFIDRLPEFKYSAYKLYRGCNIFKYLRLYRQYPQLEMLMKLGFSRIAMSTTILKRCGTDKAFCKWLISNKALIQSRHYYIDVIVRAYKTRKSLEQLQAYKEAKLRLIHDSSLAPIKELFKGKDLERFFDFIAKQQTNSNTYLDYLKACQHLGLDMTEEKNRFPHDFKRWHDIRIDEYATKKAMEDEEKRKELYTKFEEIANKYNTLQHSKRSSFICIIAHSPADLIREGEMLHHCVGRMGYDQKFVREETLIFFIRNKQEPDTPFVTVEYSLKNRKILQCYGEHDHKPSEDVLHYVNKVWLPYANRTLKQIAA